MKCTWMYSGPDGRSHFADLEIPSASEILAAPTIRFTETSRGRTNDFHPAPRRYLILFLGGVEELECGDGSVRRFGAGDILLCDDTTGQGHLTRDLEDCRRVFITMPDGFDPNMWRMQGAGR